MRIGQRLVYIASGTFAGIVLFCGLRTFLLAALFSIRGMQLDAGLSVPEAFMFGIVMLAPLGVAFGLVPLVIGFLIVNPKRWFSCCLLWVAASIVLTFLRPESRYFEAALAINIVAAVLAGLLCWRLASYAQQPTSAHSG